MSVSIDTASALKDRPKRASAEYMFTDVFKNSYVSIKQMPEGFTIPMQIYIHAHDKYDYVVIHIPPNTKTEIIDKREREVVPA